ncbi:MAG: GIY-YIG nuclease family protein [Acidobacteria bacterium]|nr:GIY-YIG nuclease family protein [Acidobacteriota bacterium]
MFYVYILRCADGTLYTGYTINLKARVEAHNTGRGAKYTRSRRPVAMVYSRGFRSLGKALAREYAMKQLTRIEKETLISTWSARTTRRWPGSSVSAG